MRTYAGTLDKSHAVSTTTIAGWVQKQRDFGELVFIDVRDRSGIVQVIVDRSKGASEELLAIAKELRSEFVVRIAGEVRERSESTKNPKMPTGDVEIVATSIELLSRAETPPFPIDDEVDAAEDLRLKYRYLDLRRPALTR
ncbi:MAG: aspartyl-tRNA synthetase, partial [Thermoanaerobaculia bacterium]|nr:aspartyl-tRNA synthetase [Thermoanaerobaculia bacterium]